MTVERIEARATPHPLHALLLSFPIALFTSAVVSDIAYLKTSEVQWTNFSQWLISGGLVFGGLIVAWALIALIVHLRSPSRGRRILYLGVVVVMWLVGLLNAFKHSQDGWSSVGGFGLTLSAITAVLALIAGVIAFSGYTRREVVR
ncbi:MAG: hypothetical protein EON90_06160 [Brevundimonas sp.]|nr:MAG: hypothetical protein EON90_06160 [Brevundimonas sp.]